MQLATSAPSLLEWLKSAFPPALPFHIMVSLKDLPYEFVFLSKAPNSVPCVQPLQPVRTPPASFRFQCTPRPAGITRMPKPAVASLYIKRGKRHLERGIRMSIRKAVRDRYRNFQHHQHKSHLHPKEDWRAEYQRMLPDNSHRAPVNIETRAKLLSDYQKKVKQNDRSVARYLRYKEGKQGR